MSDFRIEQVAIGKLKPAKRNARTHSKKQIHQIAASITEFGFTNPVLVDRRDQILAGHGRFEAAKLLGLPNVPVIRLEHLTEQQKRAYAIADNKLALNAGWDLDILAADLKELSELELPFDIEITGFATAEIDQLLDGPSKPVKNDPLDSVPPLSATDVAPFFAQRVPFPHSVVTQHLIDEAGQPTIAARDEILAFFAHRLAPPK